MKIEQYDKTRKESYTQCEVVLTPVYKAYKMVKLRVIVRNNDKTIILAEQRNKLQLKVDHIMNSREKVNGQATKSARGMPWH